MYLSNSNNVVSKTVKQNIFLDILLYLSTVHHHSAFLFLASTEGISLSYHVTAGITYMYITRTIHPLPLATTNEITAYFSLSLLAEKLAVFRQHITKYCSSVTSAQKCVRWSSIAKMDDSEALIFRSAQHKHRRFTSQMNRH